MFRIPIQPPSSPHNFHRPSSCTPPSCLILALASPAFRWNSSSEARQRCSARSWRKMRKTYGKTMGKHPLNLMLFGGTLFEETSVWIPMAPKHSFPKHQIVQLRSPFVFREKR